MPTFRLIKRYDVEAKDLEAALKIAEKMNTPEKFEIDRVMY